MRWLILWSPSCPKKVLLNLRMYVNFSVCSWSLYSLIRLYIETIICVNLIIWCLMRLNGCPSLWSLLGNSLLVLEKNVDSEVGRCSVFTSNNMMFVHHVVQTFYVPTELCLFVLLVTKLPVGEYASLLHSHFNCDMKTVFQGENVTWEIKTFTLNIFSLHLSHCIVP